MSKSDVETQNKDGFIIIAFYLVIEQVTWMEQSSAALAHTLLSTSMSGREGLISQ